MQSLIARTRSTHVGQPCVLCPHTIKAGQSILVETITEIRFGTGRTRRHHTACMRALVERAPVGVDEFADLRQRIEATANPYA